MQNGLSTKLSAPERLKQLEYDVSEGLIDSGEKAVEKAEELCANMVLMDVRLKGEMDGTEAARIIRDRFDIPIVYLTAPADEDILQRAKVTHPFGYLLKSVRERPSCCHPDLMRSGANTVFACDVFNFFAVFVPTQLHDLK